MVSAEESETTRVEAFSDGVFAIAITLLILEIRLPHDIAPGTLGRALGVNLLLLLGVTFVPFPTAVVAQHIQGSDARVAAIFYNATFCVIAVFFNVLWRYASHDNRLLAIFFALPARRFHRE